MCIGTPPYFFYEFSFISIFIHEYAKRKFENQHIEQKFCLGLYLVPGWVV